MNRRIACGALLLTLLALAFAVADTTTPANLTASLTAGKIQLKSAGALAFGPEGVLFVGDSIGGTVAEIDTGDRQESHAAKIDIEGIDTKIAAMAGVTPEDIAINDVKVNPLSRNVYLSVTRGRGPDAAAMIVKVSAAGQVTNVALDNIK